MKLYQIANVSILDHTFYDITGTAVEGVALTKNDARLMMQSLLAALQAANPLGNAGHSGLRVDRGKGRPEVQRKRP